MDPGGPKVDMVIALDLEQVKTIVAGPNLFIVLVILNKNRLCSML